jgi:peptidoglycan/xylan/chitin deacetylase (PgdA/CDA1 family)
VSRLIYRLGTHTGQLDRSPNKALRPAQSRRGRVPERGLVDLIRWPLRAMSRGLAQFTFPRRIVLLYHSIGSAPHSVSVDMFTEQMRYLANHVRVVSFDRILDEPDSANDGITCAITFDDGYANFYEKAFPVLNRCGFSSLIYVTTGAICDVTPGVSDQYPGLFPGEKMLTWTMLSELVKHGVSVGSHLGRHVDMTKLSRAEALEELHQSRSAITNNLGVPCTHFAYPFGKFSHDNVQRVWEAGYKSASTVEHRIIPSELDEFRIPRMCVAPIHSLKDFKAMLRGDLDYLRLMQKLRNSLGIGYPVLVHDAGSASSR